MVSLLHGLQVVPEGSILHSISSSGSLREIRETYGFLLLTGYSYCDVSSLRAET